MCIAGIAKIRTKKMLIVNILREKPYMYSIKSSSVDRNCSIKEANISVFDKKNKWLFSLIHWCDMNKSQVAEK